MIERGPSITTLDRDAGDHGHEDIPTLAGFRWRNGSAVVTRRTEAPIDVKACW